jgi:multidrug efflux pump subunit AcrA (membrane-fusion protein)
MASDTTFEAQSLPAPQRTNSQTASRRSRWKLVVAAIGVVAAVATIRSSAGSSGAFGPVSVHTIKRGELLVSVTEQGTLESSNNTEVKCKVRGNNTIISVIESGTEVEADEVLVRLDTLLIEEEISERTKFAHLARSAVARSKADVARAELEILEYVQGRFVSDLATLQKDLAIAESKLRSAKNLLGFAKMMAKSEYASELEVEEKQFAVAQADLELKLTDTKIDVLKRFTKREQLATLNGTLNAARAKYEAEKERAYADEQRLKRAQEELGQCVVRAKRGGMVIYPTGKAWGNAPDIEEGATVHKDQVLLLMPDLANMQVKVGIHESVIDRVRAGLSAKVTLPGKTLKANITSVASVAKPAGWWTGNVVKYDTIVELPSVKGLKPGMSVEVEVILARHEDVLMIPTAAVMETRNGHACWVKRADKAERRKLKLGDSNNMFIVVKAGLSEGDQVILDPLAHVAEAQDEAAAVIDEAKARKQNSSEL